MFDQTLQNIALDKMAEIDGAAADVEAGKAALARVYAAANACTDKIAVINADPNLSEVGKSAKRAEAREVAGRDLERVSKDAVGRIARRIEELGKMMSPPKRTANDAVLLALHRQRMAAIYKDPLEIAQVCLAAAQHGDYETLAAVDAAMPWDPLFKLDPTMRRQVEKIRTSYTHPDATRELEALTAIDMQLRAAIESAKRSIGLDPLPMPR